MRLSVAIICMILSCVSFEVETSPTRFEFSERHMGTEFTIVLYARSPEAAARSSKAAYAEIARLDAIMSDYDETSELNRACRSEAGKWIEVSRDLYRVLEISQSISEKTEGAFDVTAGLLTKLWRHARRQERLPDPERLNRALALTGYRKLHLDSKLKAIRFEQSGMSIDLGGIAKGYAADEAMKILKQQGIRSALVVAGGEVVMSDPPPGLAGWKVEVASAGRLDMFLLLQNCAVSTSGDAEQFFELGGVRFSHVLDPRTGQPVTGHSSVTVVASTGVTSDAWATALGVLGPEKGIAFVDDLEGVAALIIREENGKVRAFESKGWSAVPKADFNRKENRSEKRGEENGR